MFRIGSLVTGGLYHKHWIGSFTIPFTTSQYGLSSKLQWFLLFTPGWKPIRSVFIAICYLGKDGWSSSKNMESWMNFMEQQSGKLTCRFLQKYLNYAQWIRMVINIFLRGTIFQKKTLEQWTTQHKCLRFTADLYYSYYPICVVILS